MYIDITDRFRKIVRHNILYKKIISIYDYNTKSYLKQKTEHFL